MKSISKSETDFIKSLCISGKRLENRTLSQERHTHYTTNLYPKADISLLLSKGNTKIELTIKFTNFTSPIEPTILNTTTATSNLQNNMFDITAYINQILNEYNIDCIVEYRVLCDDGNIKGALFNMLHFIFKDLYVPNINDLNNLIKVRKVDVLVVKTFAVFDDAVVIDPSRVEEMCADSVVYVLLRNDVVIGFEVEKSKWLDPFILSNIIARFL